jgi:hypothetical protein
VLPLLAQAPGMTPGELRALASDYSKARARAPARPPRAAVERGAGGAGGEGPLAPVAAAGAAVAQAGAAVVDRAVGALGLAS